MARKNKGVRHPSFGPNLAYWRQEKLGLSQTAFAMRFGLSRRLLNGWESGKLPVPPYSTVDYLAQCLSIPVAYLWDHLPPLQ